MTKNVFNQRVPYLSLCLFLLLLMTISCSNDEVMSAEMETIKSTDNLRKAPTDLEGQLALLKQKMQRFHNFQVAVAQGYEQVSPYVPQMGYHFAKFEYVDGEFKLLEPEILVYHPDQDGNMVFGAVEYLIPVTDYDNPPPAPEGFIGDLDHWHLNPDAGGWTLHAWVGMENEAGVFVPFNSKVPVEPN